MQAQVNNMLRIDRPGIVALNTCKTELAKLSEERYSRAQMLDRWMVQDAFQNVTKSQKNTEKYNMQHGFLIHKGSLFFLEETFTSKFFVPFYWANALAVRY